MSISARGTKPPLSPTLTNDEKAMLPFADRMPTVERLLGARGVLAGALPGFAPRPQQIALARSVESALRQGRPCLAEAGTGVGKTMAYLVPVLRWLEKNGGCAVISTHTLALQAQLIERDIPTLLAALPEFDIRAAVLKGRSNFLCLQDLAAASAELWTQGDAQFQHIQRWSNETDSGDVSELDFSYRDWFEIAANADTCRQRECRFYDKCFYFKARRDAEECNLLVVNHALFFADLRLRRANPGAPSLIPHYDVVVFDEAHHVEDMATRAFGLEWGSRRLPQLVARVRRLSEAIDPAQLALLESLNQTIMAPFLSAEQPEAFLDEVVRSEADQKAFIEHGTMLCGNLDLLARDLVKISEQANDLNERDRAAGLARTATRLSTELSQVTKAESAPDEEAEYFRWYQTRKMGRGSAMTTLTRTPLTIDKTMQKVLFAETPRVIFASATLASGGGFSYIRRRMGIDGETVPAPVEILEGSPFDYARNCLLYVPRHLGSPVAGQSGGRYTDALIDEITALIEAAKGRTFALFTSHRMLQAAEAQLRDRIRYPLFVQGEMPNGRLIESFVAAGNGVLLGTSSFWEGVDVRGEALSCVIMDKLPFATPDAPMQRARENDIKASGGDAFRDFSLPQAQLRLKQGFGRLLRGVEDRGVVAILDERLWTKSYGREFLNDLPSCPRTDDRGIVEQFFKASDAIMAKEGRAKKAAPVRAGIEKPGSARAAAVKGKKV